MRVIAGQLKGRLFDAPKGHRTHPMSERMRNALFNSLGDLTELIVLDAYGGSGALTFESISRGVEHVDICEIDRRARMTIESNIEKLNIEDKATLHKANCITWVKAVKKDFDVIFADPPYGLLNYSHLDVLSLYLGTGGLLVVSHDSDFEYETDLTKLETKSFARGNLSFYRKK